LSTERNLAHAIIATSIDGKNPDHVSSWTGEDPKAITGWNQEEEVINRETDVARRALEEGKAVALTKDNDLDPFIAKAEIMLSAERSPSYHKFSAISNCQSEAGRLFMTALQLYYEETGKGYSGLTTAGGELINEKRYQRLTNKEFQSLYEKVNDQSKDPVPKSKKP